MMIRCVFMTPPRWSNVPVKHKIRGTFQPIDEYRV